MAESEIDRYGRVLIPKAVRERLGLSDKTLLEISVRGQELVLRPKHKELDEAVHQLVAFLRDQAPRGFVNPPSEGDSKWLSREYCLRKIGL